MPGAEAAKLVAVSLSGFEPGLDLDAAFEPTELLAAWAAHAPPRAYNP